MTQPLWEAVEPVRQKSEELLETAKKSRPTRALLDDADEIASEVDQHLKELKKFLGDDC